MNCSKDGPRATTSFLIICFLCFFNITAEAIQDVGTFVLGSPHVLRDGWLRKENLQARPNFGVRRPGIVFDRIKRPNIPSYFFGMEFEFAPRHEIILPSNWETHPEKLVKTNFLEYHPSSPDVDSEELRLCVLRPRSPKSYQLRKLRWCELEEVVLGRKSDAREWMDGLASVEVVTPPLAFEIGNLHSGLYEKLLPLLHNGHGPESGSVHVHINMMKNNLNGTAAQVKSGKEIIGVLLGYVWFQRVMNDNVFARHRWDPDFGYFNEDFMVEVTGPNRFLNGSSLEYVQVNKDSESMKLLERVLRLITFHHDASAEVADKFNVNLPVLFEKPFSRKLAINLNNLFPKPGKSDFKGTLEFRQMHSLVDADTSVAWVSLLMAMVHRFGQDNFFDEMMKKVWRESPRDILLELGKLQKQATWLELFQILKESSEELDINLESIFLHFESLRKLREDINDKVASQLRNRQEMFLSAKL